MFLVEIFSNLASRFVGKLGEMVFMKSELKKGLKGVTEFQVVIEMFHMKRVC